MADGVNLPLTGSGDSVAKVATDDAGAAGQVQIIKLAVSADGSAVIVPADAEGLYTQVRLEDPQDQLLIATNVGPGVNVDLDATDIPLGKHGRLIGADLGSSLPFRWDIQVVNGSRVTRATVYTGHGGSEPWRSPAFKFIEVAGGVGVHFGVSATNLSSHRTADGRAALYWDEVTP